MAKNKNNLLRFQSITNAAMTTSITSPVTNIQHLDDIGYQFNFSGAPVGTFQIQISADYAQDLNGAVSNPGNWIPVTIGYYNGSSIVTSNAVPTSVGSPVYLDLTLLSAPWIRAVYNFTSGSGTLNAYVTAKEI